jgi:hypothetical protein
MLVIILFGTTFSQIHLGGQSLKEIGNTKMDSSPPIHRRAKPLSIVDFFLTISFMRRKAVTQTKKNDPSMYPILTMSVYIH